MDGDDLRRTGAGSGGGCRHTQGTAKLYDGPQKPRLVVYAQATESYLIGCPAVSALFGRNSTVVSGDNWSKIVETNPVAADLRCDGSVKAYVDEASEQRYIVLKHRDGEVYRHKVDSAVWFIAFKAGDPTRASQAEMEKVAAKEGHPFSRAF